jgi:hypothetical protein
MQFSVGATLISILKEIETSFIIFNYQSTRYLSSKLAMQIMHIKIS